MKDTALLAKFGLSLLGRFELTGEDGVIHLQGRKLAGLLSYLAYTAPRPQSREKLATLLWGSHFETQARQNLRYALFRLRRILGRDAFINSDDEISLAPGIIACDAARFEALIGEGSPASLAAAVALYQGPLLADLNIEQEAWSDWRAALRERLEELALDTMIGHGRHALNSGNPGSALNIVNRAVAMNGLREDAHRLIIEAMTAAGRTAEALKHYEDFVVLIRRDLNAEPDAATQSLVAELRGAKPSGILRKNGECHPDMPGSSGPEIGAETAAAQHDDPSAIVANRSDTLEQRQLTIMTCSLIGSMTLLARLDPEDGHDLVATFHEMVADAAARFAGFVAQYQGNGVTVYFGYPTSHEHDAEQAVRAGFAILDSIGRLHASSGVNIQASVGIATGLVVVGTKWGARHAPQHIAIGEAPGLAARLEAAAAPGEIIVEALTRRLAGRMFDYHALPDIEVKGRSQPVEAWQVHGEMSGVSRFDARGGATLSPLVGRQEDMELLLRRWHQARAGEGRVVVVSGEPGIGKSRIAESLLVTLKQERHTNLRYFCSPHHTHSALYPFIAQINQDVGFAPGSSASTRLDRLEALLKPTTTNLPRDVTVIAELLGVPMDGRYPALAINPQQKREMTLNALLNQLDGAASLGPILIVFEDAHWIDPTSLDLLDRIVSRAKNLPLLLLVTLRPEVQLNWVGQPHVTMLPLSRLGRGDSAGIIQGITQDKALPDVVVEKILSRTDGIPLFIEELTCTLLESELLREVSYRDVLDGPLPPRAVPTTLQASLAARLDLLGPAKAVATIGAAIGREFSHELIAAVSALAPIDIDAALQRLTSSGLISRRGAPPEASYLFKHALVQEAAYATMIRSRRQRLHASIAKALIEKFPAQTESQPEIVAHHFTEAGLASEAVGYWVKAGRLAQARWANREAATFLERALGLLETLPETRESLEQAIDLRFDLKTALFPLGQFQRIVSYLREAGELAKRLDDKKRLCLFYVHMCQTLNLSGNPEDAVTFGRDALVLARFFKDVPLQVAAALFLGLACFSTLDYRQAEHHLLDVLEMLGDELSLEQFFLAGFPAISARAFLTRIYADRGKFEHGIAHGEEGIRLAEAVDHPYSLAIVSWCLADLLASRGELSRAVGLLERGLAVAREWNLPFLVAANSGSLGYVYALQGRAEDGLPLLQQALGVFEKMQHRFAQSLFLVSLSEAYMRFDRPAEALNFAQRALTLARENGQRSGEASALRLLGEASVSGDLSGHAEGYYREALALAMKLEMGPLAAHCHFGLGKMYLRGGLPDRARDQLTTVTMMYREMDMGFWLDQANVEMRQLQVVDWPRTTS
jgi:class 3 adenylate cyclase/DNA-binding SARP family transcriptional activator